MKFTLALSTLATVAVVCADSVVLALRGAGGNIVGYANTMASKDAGKLYVSVSPTSQRFIYENGLVSIKIDDQVLKMGLDNAMLALGSKISPKVFPKEGVRLSSGQFWVCDGVTVPGVTLSGKFLLNTEVGKSIHDKCEKVVVEVYVCETEIPVIDCLTSSRWANGTVAPVTKTSYVTYCPSSTTITITTCDVQLCYAKALTVTTATTITCDYCILPQNAAAAKTPAASKAAQGGQPVQSPVNGNASLSANQAKPSVKINSVNGGASNVVGFAGVLALAALIM